jgi:hypothetical protein
MTQDVRQWLAEIKSLQQAVAAAQKERDDAYQGAANWRKLYETEAQQRRTDARLAQEKIAELQAELLTIQGQDIGSPEENTSPDNLREQVAQLKTPEALQEALISVMAERDRLRQSLQQERIAHEKTRKDLIGALGDTMDRLTQHQGSSTTSASKVAEQSSSTHPASR